MIRNKPNSRARARDYMWRKAKHKRYIDHITSSSWSSYYFYNNLHQYSKNKIHCSCPSCSPKTKNKGRRRQKDGNYSPSLNYKHSDLVKKIIMDEKIKEYLLGEDAL